MAQGDPAAVEPVDERLHLRAAGRDIVDDEAASSAPRGDAIGHPAGTVFTFYPLKG